MNDKEDTKLLSNGSDATVISSGKPMRRGK
jgi:hypothetical protein